MRVLVEASAACDQRAGIGRYSRNILRRLLAQSQQDTFKLLRAPETNRQSLFDPIAWPHANLFTLPFNRRDADRLWFRLRLPLDARFFVGGADVVYSPDFTAPPAWGVPRVITIHDLAFLTHPDKTTDALRRFLDRVVPGQISAAQFIMTVSQATADDVRQYYDVNPAKIIVAPNAVDEAFYRGRVLTHNERMQQGLPQRYFVMLGTIEPRKNHALALDAIVASGVGDRVPLVIIGRPGWGHEQIVARIRDLEQQGIVRYLDSVDDDRLPDLIASSQGMIYPSWTEGFGLPVVEALATGIPVITGTAPALREAGGAFARYIDPQDVTGLAAEMRALAGTPSDAIHDAARVEWTRRFSWDYSSSLVYDAIRKATEK